MYKYLHVNLHVRFYFFSYQEILRFHLREGDSEQVLATCKSFGHQDPNLWVQALWSIAKNKDAPTKLLADILAYIGKYSLRIFYARENASGLSLQLKKDCYLL